MGATHHCLYAVVCPSQKAKVSRLHLQTMKLNLSPRIPGSALGETAWESQSQMTSVTEILVADCSLDDCPGQHVPRAPDVVCVLDLESHDYDRLHVENQTFELRASLAVDIGSDGSPDDRFGHHARLECTPDGAWMV